MEIIRIPSAYLTQIDYLSGSDSDYVLKTIFGLAGGRDIKIEKSMRGGLVLSIWREAIQMENKARAKKGKERLEIDTATLMADTDKTLGVKNSATKESKIKSSQIKENQEIELYKPQKQVFQEDSFEYIISKQFLDFHKQEQTPSILYLINSKGEEDILNKWSDEVRKLKEIDKFTEKQIKFIIDFTLKDDFWKNQIQSMDKFRKKKDGISYFVKMIDKAKEGAKTNLTLNPNLGTL